MVTASPGERNRRTVSAFERSNPDWTGFVASIDEVDLIGDFHTEIKYSRTYCCRSGCMKCFDTSHGCGDRI